MIPVALVAAALVPVAAAQVLDLSALPADGGNVYNPTLQGIASDVPTGPNEAAVLQMMQEWRIRHHDSQQDTTDDQAAAADGQAQPQDSGHAQGAPGRQSPAAQIEQARDDAMGQAQQAQGQAQEKARVARDQAGNVTGQLPSDPMGYASDSAKGAYGQITGMLPLPVSQESLAPQDGGHATIAQDKLIPPILAGSIVVLGAAGATFFAFWLAGSSGTLGASAAASKSTELRRLLPFASPLFTRFEKETVLGHPRREALYALILQQPGVSLQSLGEATGLSRTAVLHHLRLLEMQHLVVSKRMGRSRHYYENGGRYGRDAKDAYAILQNQRSKEVADYIRTHPGTMQKQLCEALDIQPSIAHWHVRRLQAAQLVDAVHQGRAVNYFPGSGLLEVAAQPPLPALPELPVDAPAPMAVSGSMA